MKNRAKKVIAICLGVCLFALLFVSLFFIYRPYTEKVVIWLPNNYKLENTVQNEIVSIMLDSDTEHQSNATFYSLIDIDSFKKLFGNSERVVSVKIEDTVHRNPDFYQIIYQTKFDCAEKSFVVVAQEDYSYNKKVLSEMKLRGSTLFLKNKRDKHEIFFLSTLGFVVIAGVVCFLCIDIRSKQSNN